MGYTTLKGIKKDELFDNSQLDETVDYVDSQAASGQADVVVSNGAQFVEGQQVILYNGQNSFETATISSIVGNTLTMTANLTNTYEEGSFVGRYYGFLDTQASKFTRMIAPDLGDGSDGAYVSAGNETWNTDKNFTSVTIQNGHTITVEGNIQIKCQGTFHIEAGGIISAKGKGHSGGSNNGFQGFQGTSYTGAGGDNDTANGGGGGGGRSNPYGGGGGGYGSSGSNATAAGSGGGFAGGTYNDTELNNTFETAYLKGSGGGAASRSAGSSDANLRGGHGGGIIRIHAKNLIVEGEIDCDGEDGKGDGTAGYSGGNSYGGSGAGSGGTIFLQVLNKCTLGNNLVHSVGGTGGTGNTGRNGGNGGNGRIRIECFGKVSGTTSPAYASGYNTNIGGYTKYGWYFTSEIETDLEVITVNAYVKQAMIESQNLSGAANSGQADVDIVSASEFNEGDKVIVKEGAKYELLEIDSIVGDTLTMTTNLSNSYTASAVVYRIDAYAYASLVDTGDDENVQALDLYAADNLGNDIWQIVYSKTFKTNNNESGGTRLLGVVRLQGKTNDSNDVKLKEVSWSYY